MQWTKCQSLSRNIQRFRSKFMTVAFSTLSPIDFHLFLIIEGITLMVDKHFHYFHNYVKWSIAFRVDISFKTKKHVNDWYIFFSFYSTDEEDAKRVGQGFQRKASQILCFAFTDFMFCRTLAQILFSILNIFEKFLCCLWFCYLSKQGFWWLDRKLWNIE